ncbi:MAG: helix-turn-helix domain-containing protein [Bosea sp.]|uniref:helix-turn-helix transcriptional regulator n=1 Tax=Bosea sp. (in: a-proteobacteria) TaxID=1871050 RepID=UPI0023989F7B|nr:helix-turn-helix domain-containing protein [Bosea sp. (in: a-proteobacteria)]MCP4733811.1 helix-turn-helix domain-containing protein [Bosea sp. (in: a-proteobacteria)]
MVRNAEEFGRLVRQHRQAVGLTQDELAARCGVTRRTIIDLEAGKAGTHLGNALAAACEVGLRLAPLPREPASSDHPVDPDDPLATLPRF